MHTGLLLPNIEFTWHTVSYAYHCYCLSCCWWWLFVNINNRKRFPPPPDTWWGILVVGMRQLRGFGGCNDLVFR